MSDRGNHFELRATSDGHLVLYLLTRSFVVRPPGNATAVVEMDIPGYPDVELRRTGDRLEGRGPPIEVAHPKAFVTVHADDAIETATISLHVRRRTR